MNSLFINNPSREEILEASDGAVLKAVMPKPIRFTRATRSSTKKEFKQIKMWVRSDVMPISKAERWGVAYLPEFKRVYFFCACEGCRSYKRQLGKGHSFVCITNEDLYSALFDGGAKVRDFMWTKDMDNNMLYVQL